MEVRQIFEHELESAFPVVAELRTHLDMEEFGDSVRRQAELGYELWGAFEGRTVLGVIGFRPAQNLAWGAHLHVDDLVVTARLRTSPPCRADPPSERRQMRRGSAR